MFDIVEGWCSIQLQDDDYGYRFWTVMPESEADAFVAEHRALGYSVDDWDQAMEIGVAEVMAKALWDADPEGMADAWYERETARKWAERQAEIASLKEFIASQPEDHNELMRAVIRLATIKSF